MCRFWQIAESMLFPALLKRSRDNSWWVKCQCQEFIFISSRVGTAMYLSSSFGKLSLHLLVRFIDENLIQTSSKRMIKRRVLTSSSSSLAVDMAMQTAAEAGLNTQGSSGWSPAGELCKKLPSFSFARCLWVTDTNMGSFQRSISQPHRVLPSSARGCRFNSPLTNFRFWSHERRNENSSEKCQEKQIYFYIWWSKNVSETNKIQSFLSCLFFFPWLPCFFFLKKNTNKI